MSCLPKNQKLSLKNMSQRATEFEEDFDVGWPCRSCGAMQADGFETSDSLEIVKCTNCGLMAENQHVDSINCWCEPQEIGEDKETGLPLYKHNEIH